MLLLASLPYRSNLLLPLPALPGDQRQRLLPQWHQLQWPSRRHNPSRVRRHGPSRRLLRQQLMVRQRSSRQLVRPLLLHLVCNKRLW